jgi:two-component system, sensor histidine kinase YesM
MNDFMEKVRDFLNRVVLLKNSSLIVKLLVYSGFLVIIPMLIVGIISYHRSAEVLEEEASEYSWQIIEQVKSHVEYYLRDMESDSLAVLNHPAMVALMSMKTPEEVAQSRIHPEIRQILKNTAYSRNDISHITVILDHVVVIDTEEGRSAYPASELQKEYWYSAVPPTGDLIVSRVIQWPGRTEPVMTLARRLVNPRTLEPVGMMLTDINYRRLQEIAEKVTIGRTGFLSILDAGGHYVYDPDLARLGKKAELDVTPIMSNDKGSRVARNPNGRDFITFSRSTALNWHFVTSIPYKELVQGQSYIGRTISLTVILTLIAAYSLGIAFATSLIRPIGRLQRFMKRIEVGDFSGKVEVMSKDEIGLLTHGYNKMVERLAHMRDEIYFAKLRETEMSLSQKETELKVLQSQINPHFLYNALETIRGMALEGEQNHIAVMSSSLARLLRYNLKNTSPIVSLRDELESCEVYLRIQKYRFEEKLEYTINIPEWAEKAPIAKFSLQPIIENCVIHGIEPSLDTVCISVEAVRENENVFVMELSDTGLGMPFETLVQLREDLKHRDILAGGSQIGIVNVHRRIAYLFGEDYGISIESKPNQGTKVSLRLPVKLDEEARQKAQSIEGGNPNVYSAAGG